MDSRARTLVALVGLLAVAPGPAIHAQNAKNQKNQKTLTLHVWPLPPEQPRVRYVTEYRGASDFKKKPGRWKAALLGNAPAGELSGDNFVKPYAVALSPQGRLYVSDTAARRVFVIDRDTSRIAFVGDRGSTALSKPVGLAIDAAGVVFVADATLKRVFGFAPDGTLALAIGHDGEFDSPAGLAIDRPRKRLYVVDTGRHQISCYSTTDGTHVRSWGTRGSEDGQFNFPTNAAVDAEGRVYVADTLNFRVQVFDANGGFVRAFGTLGDAPGTFNRPKGIAVDSEGHVYVADSAFNNFQIFDAGGQLLLFVGRGGGGVGEFLLPAGLFIDDRDEIFVADQGNARVQVFQYLRAVLR